MSQFMSQRFGCMKIDPDLSKSEAVAIFKTAS